MSVFRIKAALEASYYDLVQGENRKFTEALVDELTPHAKRLFGERMTQPRKATLGSYEWSRSESDSLSLRYKTGVLHSDMDDFPACLKLGGHPVWLVQLEDHSDLFLEVDVWVKPWVEVRFADGGFHMRLQYVDGVPGEWTHVTHKIDVVDNGSVVGMAKEMCPVQERRKAALKEMRALVRELEELDRFEAAYPSGTVSAPSGRPLSDLFRNTQAL